MLQLLQAITVRVAKSPTLESALRGVLREVCALAGSRIGRCVLLPTAPGDQGPDVARRAEDGTADDRTVWWSEDPDRFAKLLQIPGGRVTPPRSPVFSLDLEEQLQATGGKAARDAGLGSIYTVGVFAEGSPAAVLQFLFAEAEEPPAAARSSLEAVAAQLELIAERERGRKAVAAAAAHVRALAGRTSSPGGRSEPEARHRTDPAALRHPVTGLPTHALFLDRLEHALSRKSRHPDQTFAVLAIGAAVLEPETERTGTETYAKVMTAVIRRLRAVSRQGDTLGHSRDFPLGAILEEVTSTEDALEVARRFETSLSRPITLGKSRKTLRPHIGVLLVRPGHERPESILRDASLALDEARQTRSGVALFDTATRARSESASRLEPDLRGAIHRREMHLHYQPIVWLQDGRITAMEAFLRWTHPKLGQVPPEEFLPVAEQLGLMGELGYWVVDRGCRQLRKWQQTLSLGHPPTLAINITAGQFYDRNLIGRATAALKATQLEPSQLRFDVSESTFVRDPTRAVDILTQLKQHGIRTAIDDFGSGHSSISDLHRFPVSALKIDRAFVSGTRQGEQGWKIAGTIVTLARILGIEVIAEGVETQEQLLRLRELGCNYAQGYLFAGPLPPAKAAAVMRDGYPIALQAAADEERPPD